ncbi:MAG: tryptophan synthase subunit alpha [Polyangiaceae bacterium]
MNRSEQPMNLRDYILERRRQRDILLMTHIVIGYPNLTQSLELVDAMVEAGVDLMELQIPFSEPIADGPVILHANQEALKNGIKVNDCFEFAERVTKRHAIPFLFMSYYNVVFRRGVESFAERAQNVGVRGAIVPDCPPEEASDYVSAMRARSLAPVFIFSPRTPDERLRMLGKAGDGFVYAVARKGVTGSETEFSGELSGYLERCRDATELPLAVGFGLKSRADVDFLRGKADIAVIGTESLRLLAKSGVSSVGKFIESLRG